MDSVAGRSLALRPQALTGRNLRGLGISAFAGLLVGYLAIQGGGYDIVVRSQIGIAVWWILIVGAIVGVLPRARLGRAGWVAVGLLGAFTVWSALALTWTESAERTLVEVSRLATYVGIFALALALMAGQRDALRHAINGVAVAIVVVATLAVLSRLRPDLFPAAQQTAEFLPSLRGRLGWPLDYWNALSALMAMGIPLLLGVAFNARRIATQALAGAALPLLVLCQYLTFSRGGAIATVVALIVFVTLAPERLPKLATLVAAGIGSAALIVGVVHRPAVEHGLTNEAAQSAGGHLVVVALLACAGVGAAQLAISLAARHATPPRWMTVSPRAALIGTTSTIAVLVLVAVIAGAPGRLDHAWQSFKKPPKSAPGLRDTDISRFAIVSGNERYQLWKVAVHSGDARPLLGTGPGTYEYTWLRHSSNSAFVQNAHSLPLETYAEAGIIGAALIVALFAALLALGVRRTVQARYWRLAPAAATAAIAAMAVSAAIDWTWQVAALPAAMLVLAAGLATRGLGRPASSGVVPRVVGVVVCLAAVVVIAMPLASTNAVRASQDAAATNMFPAALSEARSAAAANSSAASPHVQEALVLELSGDLAAAESEARQAVADDGHNWRTWLVLSRIAGRRGDDTLAIRAYRRAHSLNPRSPIFQSG